MYRAVFSISTLFAAVSQQLVSETRRVRGDDCGPRAAKKGEERNDNILLFVFHSP